MYESGSGMMEYSAIVTGETTPGATEKYIAMNKDPQFYQVYLNYYNMYDSFNMTENCHYAFVGLYSKYGPWLLLEYMTQSPADAHRYRAILDIINQTRLPVKVIPAAQCYGLIYNQSAACNANGVCIDQDTCVCDANFYGQTCVPFNVNDPNVDYFANIDPRIVYILFMLFPTLSKVEIATLASNRIVCCSFFN